MNEPPKQQQQKFLIHVGVDFGTYGSGLAYALNKDDVYIHIFKDCSTTEKSKTSVLFDNHGKVQCVGSEALRLYVTSQHNEGWKLFERYKMNLYGIFT